jgi:hypothetical protein
VLEVPNKFEFDESRQECKLSVCIMWVSFRSEQRVNPVQDSDTRFCIKLSLTGLRKRQRGQLMSSSTNRDKSASSASVSCGSHFAVSTG